MKKFSVLPKELSFGHKLKFSNPYFFETLWCKPLIFQTQAFWSVRIHSLKYQRSTTSGCTDIGIIIFSLWQKLNSFNPLFLYSIVRWIPGVATMMDINTNRWKFSSVYTTIFTVFFYFKVDACQGDSGGPLTAQEFTTGVPSRVL